MHWNNIELVLTESVCVCVLQVGCNPLSDQDELHLNILEKHVSLLLLCLSLLYM